MKFEFHHFLPFIEDARQDDPAVLAVAGAADESVLETVKHAVEEGLVRALLFGDADQIEERMKALSMPVSGVEIRPTLDSALEAARAAGSGEADILMKGNVSSGAFLRAVLSDEANLRTGSLLSHVGVFDIPSHRGLLGMTDGGINIHPDFATRVKIVKNAIELGNRLWGRAPRIALMAAVETVQENMPVTLEWAAISKMADRGQLGRAEVDGPLALDNAIDPQAARQKGIGGAVAGQADLIVVPDIHAGNLVGKTLTYLAGAPMAGLVMGAKVPVVLNSRADSARARFASLVLARAVSGGE